MFGCEICWERRCSCTEKDRVEYRKNRELLRLKGLLTALKVRKDLPKILKSIISTLKTGKALKDYQTSMGDEAILHWDPKVIGAEPLTTKLLKVIQESKASCGEIEKLVDPFIDPIESE